jgi:hypothetical protein
MLYTPGDFIAFGQQLHGSLMILGVNRYKSITFKIISTFVKNQRMVIFGYSIQRAWRSYLRNKLRSQEEDDTKKDHSTEKTVQHPVETAKDTTTTLEESKDTPTTLEENKDTPTTLGENKDTPTTLGESKDTPTTQEESDSVSSSYSEVSVTDGSLRGPPGNGSLENSQNIEHYAGESVEDFNKRIRKVNLLSLAQEFAELQKVNSDFVETGDKTREESTVIADICDGQSGNTMEGSRGENRSNVGEERGSGNTDDFEVYNIETALPSLGWEDLEQKLQQATQNSSKLVSSVTTTDNTYYNRQHLLQQTTLTTTDNTKQQ